MKYTVPDTEKNITKILKSLVNLINTFNKNAKRFVYLLVLAEI